MKKQWIFVCFIGLDGSGKTTHALHLCRELQIRGIRCMYVRPRYELIRFLPSSLQRFVRRYFSIRSKLYTVRSSPLTGASLIRRMFIVIVLLAYASASHLLIKLYMRKFIVVSDRYFFDWFHGISWLADMVHLPNPALIFFLDLPPESAFSRMKSSEDRKLSLDYYKSLRTLYLNLARRRNFIIIDSNDHFERTSEAILNHVYSHVRRN